MVKRLKAAFVDLDGTLILRPTTFLMFKTGFGKGFIPTYFKKQLLKIVIFNKLGVLNYVKFSTQAVQVLQGKTPKFLKTWLSMLEDDFLRVLNKKLVSKLKQLKKQGFLIILATNEPLEIASIANKLCKPLGLTFDAFLCNKLELKNNRFTGRILNYYNQPWVGEDNKARVIERFAFEKNIDLQKSFAFTDSFRDVYILRIVGNPVVVNPDFRLWLYAKLKGWEML